MENCRKRTRRNFSIRFSPRSGGPGSTPVIHQLKEDVMVKPSRVVWRFLILATLTGCLLFVSSDQKQAALLVTCTTCDTNFSTCDSNCWTEHNICMNSGIAAATCHANYQNCRDACFNTYAFCLGGCTLSGGGSSPGGCGRGRTPCELNCRTARGECIAQGGTNCGEEFQSCNIACCGG